MYSLLQFHHSRQFIFLSFLIKLDFRAIFIKICILIQTFLEILPFNTIFRFHISSTRGVGTRVNIVSDNVLGAARNLKTADKGGNEYGTIHFNHKHR
jgi:hypothetical protein